MIMVRIFTALELIPADIEPRPYAPDWHLHRSDEKYLGWVQQYAHQVDTPQPGDIALFKFGRCLSHGGIVDQITPDITMIHADMYAGCVERAEVRRWADRLAGYWRIGA
jgi:hypothetical protein